MRSAVALLAATGCAYQPGSFATYHDALSGSRARVGCIDLAVAAEPTDRGAVLKFVFGNRCDRSVVVDLASVHVRANGRHGETLKLVAFDPRVEITPLPIDARMWGREQIEFRAMPGSTSASIVDVCADVGRIDPGSSGDEHQLCLPMPGGAS